MALEAYVRGLSMRDIEQTFRDERGRPLLSRSAASRLTDRLSQEYEAFCQRDLSEFDAVVLFVDGVYEAVRRYTNNQALLCAWAICSDGKKVLVHLAADASESRAAWEAFFDDLQRRGLRHPLLIVSDGNAGVIAAIEGKFPHSDRQRCLVHKLRNIAAKLPRDVQDTVLREFKAVYYAESREIADVLAERLIERYATVYPAAVRSFTEDLEACLVYLKYPESHRRFIRTTNVLERSFEEEKRRTKIFLQHQHERAAVGLVFAVLQRASERWQRVTMTSVELAQLRNLRALIAPFTNESQFISYRIAG
jgi:transposase-like protein